jgi:hypothetical protein
MDLYDTDFFAWTQQQAEAIRAGVWDDIDRDHLAEEIAEWWKRDSHRLWQHLRDLPACPWRRFPRPVRGRRSKCSPRR